MLIQRVVFFDGMVYQIEEEIYSDEGHSSVYTSDDSFEEDDKLRTVYKQQNASRNVGTAGTNQNSLLSSNLEGFIEHKVNIFLAFLDDPFEEDVGMDASSPR